MKTQIRHVGAATALILISLPTLAHHSSAPFEDESTIRLQGTVTRLKWANPHVYIEVETRDEYGNSVQWLIEGLPPAGLRESGWSRDSLTPGEEIVFAGHPSRNSAHKRILGESIIKTDGTILMMPNAKNRSTMPPVDLEDPFVADSLSGRWRTRWNPQVASQFLAPQTRWSLTDRGREAMETYNAHLDPATRCIPEPSPYAMIWPSGKSIEISTDQIRIRDELDIERIVHMKAVGHEGADYVDQGHSIGWWEDGVLVIDTSHFAEHRRGLAFGGLASSRKKHLVERFELQADRTALTYSYWLEDPVYLSEPVSGELTLVYRPDQPFLHQPCDIESAARHLEHVPQ
ncbi:MAG: DUF6152 family protein [Gammaproteobacteria bacterium]|nr:DUF6152 family protein [Gammaproteobacteria bacterium]